MRNKKKDTCIKGCGKCCGIAVSNGQNFVQIINYAKQHGIEPIKQGSQCPWYQNGGCTVYEVRPVTCRLFGKIDHPMMRCHEGGKFIQLRPPEVARKQAAEKLLVQEHGMRFLHEVCYTIDEVKAIIQGVQLKASQSKLVQIQNLGRAIKPDTERLAAMACIAPTTPESTGTNVGPCDQA
jgi:Fe-S-cluster containining protein